MVQIINIQVDIVFVIPKLIDGVPSHAKGAEWFKWLGIQWVKWRGTVTLVPNGEDSHASAGKKSG